MTETEILISKVLHSGVKSAQGVDRCETNFRSLFLEFKRPVFWGRGWSYRNRDSHFQSICISPKGRCEPDFSSLLMESTRLVFWWRGRAEEGREKLDFKR